MVILNCRKQAFTLELRPPRRKVRTPEAHRESKKDQTRFILHPLPQAKIHRSNCSFLVQQTPDGKPTIIVRLYQDTILILQKVAIGFDLLGGTQPEQAKKVAELLNGHVLDVFVTERAADKG